MRYWWLILLVPLASAQWSPGVDLLYLDSNDAANGDEELLGFLSIDQDAGDDAALGPAATCATHTGTDVDFTVVPPSTDIDRVYAFPLQTPLAGTATIAGPIEATLHVGAGGCYGDVTLTARLLAGTTVVAEGAADHRYNDASGHYPSATFELAIVQDTFSTQEFRLEVHVTGKTGGQLFVGIGDSRGFSRITIPMTAFTEAAPAVAYGDFAVGELAVNGTGSYIYNGTGNGTLAYTSTGVGAATLRIMQDNTTLANATLPGNGTVELPDGAWSMIVDADGFNGTLSWQRVTVDNETAAPAPSMPSEPAGNETAPTARDSPLPLVWAVAALLLARRR